MGRGPEATSPVPELHTLRVGRFEVRAYSAGTLGFSIAKYMDENPAAVSEASAGNQGQATLGTNFLHVRAPGLSMMIDPGGWSDEHVRRLTDLHPISIDQNLELLSLDPGDVTDVVVSHGHPDHFQGMLAGEPGAERLRFPNARHYIHKRDLDGVALSEVDVRAVGMAFDLARDAGLLHAVDADEAEIATGVTMLHTGGESGGHCCVRFSDGGETLVYLADLLHLPEEAQYLDWSMRNRNTDELVSGRRKVLGEAERSRAVVIYTHDPIEPPWAGVAAEGDAWRLKRVD